MKKLLFFILLIPLCIYAVDVPEVVTESFSGVEYFTLVTNRTTLSGDLLEWAIRYGRKHGDKVGDLDETGIWLQGQSNYGYLEMNQIFEGGIRNISFNWGHGNEKDYTIVLRMFTRGTGGWNTEPVQTWSHAADNTSGWHEVVSYDLELKKNSRIKFDNLSVKTGDGTQPAVAKGRPVIGNITITPYLYYTKKIRNALLANGTYRNPWLINHTEGEGTITYSIQDNDGIATIDPATGWVTLLRTTTEPLTVTATWSEGASTSYQLSIIDYTVVTIKDDKGTYASKTFKAYYGQGFPADFELPTREGYRLNAFYTSSKCSKTDRITVFSHANGKRWVTHEGYVDGDRKWIYTETALNLYPLWKEERTITLDHQEASVAGTDKVVTANTLNNGFNDLSSVTCPLKDNASFGGYFTEPNGQGTKLIDKNGSFIANVPDFTNENKCWIKDEDITLYAYWVSKDIALNENSDNGSLLVACDGETKNLTLTRSDLVPNVWNTLCLPFDITLSDLDDAEVVSLSSAELNGEKLTINFTPVVGTITAGTPVLVRPAAALSFSSFEDVTLSSAPQTATSGVVSLHGIFSPFEMQAGDRSTLFLGLPDANGDNLFFPSITASLKAFRAYFSISDAEAQKVIKKARVVVQQRTPTDISPVSPSALQPVGQKVFENGQLLILRDGYVYNVLGQTIH